jgi:hypothetical protein
MAGGPAEFGERIARDLGPAFVVAGLAGVDVEFPRAGLVAFQDARHAGLLFSQRVLHLSAHRDVLEGAHRTQRLAVGIAFEQRRDQHVDVAAVLADHLVLECVGLPLAQEGRQPELDGIGPRGRRQEVEDEVTLDFVARIAGLGETAVVHHQDAAVQVHREHRRRRRAVQLRHPASGVAALRQRCDRLLPEHEGFRGCDRQVLQDLPLMVVELARDAVDDAQRAEDHAVRERDRRAGVELEMGRSRHERVVGEAMVLRCIRDLQDVAAVQGMGAERDVARRFADARQAGGGLEPLPILVDQADQRDRHAADLGGRASQGIEDRLRFGVEHGHRTKARESCGLVVGQRSGQEHGGPRSGGSTAGGPPTSCVSTGSR